MKHFLVNTAQFSLLIMGMLICVELIAPKGWGNWVLETKWSLLELGDSGPVVDLYFVGSSRVYRQIDPVVFDSETGTTTSYNLGSPSGNLLAHIEVVEGLLDSACCDPKVVILELQHVSHITDVNRHKFGAYYGHSLPNSIWASSFYRESGNYGQAAEHLGAGLDNFCKLGGLIRVARCLVSDLGPKGQLSRRAGFVSLDEELGVKAVEERRQRFLSDTHSLARRRADCSEEREAQARSGPGEVVLAARLKELAKLCEGKGVKLIFLLPPRATGLTAAFQQLPEDCRMDLGSPDRFPEFYRIGSTFDVGHLNADGAYQFTCALDAGVFSTHEIEIEGEGWQ